MIRRDPLPRPLPEGWPRTSGDDPLTHTGQGYARLLAPHERG